MGFDSVTDDNSIVFTVDLHLDIPPNIVEYIRKVQVVVVMMFIDVVVIFVAVVIMFVVMVVMFVVVMLVVVVVMLVVVVMFVVVVVIVCCRNCFFVVMVVIYCNYCCIGDTCSVDDGSCCRCDIGDGSFNFLANICRSIHLQYVLIS